jgi:NitT/TauT family transport system substrate-binding protein
LKWACQFYSSLAASLPRERVIRPERVLSLLKCVLTTSIWLLAGLCHALAQPAPVKVTVGSLSLTHDAGIFIADAKGYFAAEGLDVSLTTFRSAADMVPLLGTGQLDVGAGSPSAGLYNAILRGIKIKIVADKGHSAPGYSPLALLIRKDLVETGKYKTLKDLKGLKLAMTAHGVSQASTLNTALKSVGLAYADVETVNLPFSDQPIALANKAIDGTLAAEPFATIAVERGVAIEVMRDGEIDPGHQLACLFFSEAFAGKADAAVRFLRAYVKGVRIYTRALKDGRIAGENAEDVLAILTKYTSIKDAALLRRITPPALHPDGRVNIDSLQRDFDFYLSQGLVQGRLAVKDLVDEALLNAAVKSLSGSR